MEKAKAKASAASVEWDGKCWKDYLKLFNIKSPNDL